MIITTIFLILEFVTGWLVFEKYGEKGWKALIPFYNTYIEYGKVWYGYIGIAFLVLDVIANACEKAGKSGFIVGIIGLALAVIKFIFSYKKSKAFGKGIGFALVLLIFPFIGNLILGFGDAKYQGNPTA